MACCALEETQPIYSPQTGFIVWMHKNKKSAPQSEMALSELTILFDNRMDKER